MTTVFECLFLVEEWILDPSRQGGATALAMSHLELALRTFDGVNLGLIKQTKGSGPENLDLFLNTFPLMRQCNSFSILNITQKEPSAKLARLWQFLFDPSKYRYSCLDYRQVRVAFDRILENHNNTLIWAEHLFPASVALVAETKLPIVYSHHDWNWKIKQLRQTSSLRKKMDHWASKRHETSLVKKVAACVSGSITEANSIRQLGSQRVEYFPTTYPVVDLDLSFVPERTRIVHLGSMKATANRLGLQRFLEMTWPLVCKRCGFFPEFWVIGDLVGASQELLQMLEDTNATCTGFVADLSTVLRPYDIHIVPWEYDTGTRTRIPLVLNYAQALVSTTAAASCIAELEDGRNCILVEDLTIMADNICDLIEDDQNRIRLSKSGRETYLSQFTLESQTERFKGFVRKVAQSGHLQNQIKEN